YCKPQEWGRRFRPRAIFSVFLPGSHGARSKESRDTGQSKVISPAELVSRPAGRGPRCNLVADCLALETEEVHLRLEPLAHLLLPGVAQQPGRVNSVLLAGKRSERCQTADETGGSPSKACAGVL